MKAGSHGRSLNGVRGASLGLMLGMAACAIYEGRSLDLFAEVNGALACRQSIECPRERALCSRGACVECLSSSECRGGKPRCEDGRCVECSTSGDCAPSQTCNTALGSCALRCAQPSDCAGQGAVVCDTELELCVECAADIDCRDPRNPACDRGGRCVECTSPSQCGAERPACHVFSGRCVECSSDADCQGGVCDERDSRCVECTSDVHCPGGSCDLPSRTCHFACTSSAGCDSARPHCNAATGFCVACLSPADCGEPRKPACSADGRCTECALDADCTAPDRPACVVATGKCAECTRPEQCPADSTCELETARCVPLPPPQPPGP